MLNKADPRVDADLKRTGVDAARGATPGTGEAAIGQTATYGSYSVGLGDRTSSTIDPSSEGMTTPNTYIPKTKRVQQIQQPSNDPKKRT